MDGEAHGETFDVGDRVRIDIPDETHPDFSYHGKNGEIISVITSHGGPVGGEPTDNRSYRVELDVGGTIDVGRRDLRPPI